MFWQVEQMRLTAMATWQLATEGVFHTLTGQEPDESVQRKGGSHSEVGVIEDCVLSIEVAPGRVDFRAGRPASEIDIETVTFPFLSQAALSRIETIFGNAIQWLSERPVPPARLAYGAVLLHPVASRAEGYALLERRLRGLTLDPTKTEDFLIQFNEPTAGPDGMRINNLVKWSVAARQKWLQIFLASQPPVVSSPTLPQFALRLELDVNTDATRTDSLKAPAQTWAALLESARRLSNEGAES